MEDTCARAIILGTRPPGLDDHEEQWHALRATAIDALIQQHRANEARDADGRDVLSAQDAASAAYEDCRQAMQKIVTNSRRAASDRHQQNLARRHCVKPVDATRPLDAWYEAWTDTGLVHKATTRQNILLPLDQADTRAPATPKAQPPPQPLPPRTRVAYTDGSGPDTPGSGDAGWGYTIVSGGDGDADDHAVEEYATCGRVETDQQAPKHIGATKGTNNTAELTAIAEALEHVLADVTRRPTLIRFDSLYAGNMAAGKWRPRHNKQLVRHVKGLWDRAHSWLRGKLWASHVRGHSQHKWNDRADELADMGKGGAPAKTRRRRG